MRKCVKIIITDFGDIDSLYALLKKKVSFDGIEGTAEPYDDNEVHVIVYGPKEMVDDFVEEVEAVINKEADQNDRSIGLLVEPYLKDEDYRGVFRFIKIS